MNEPTHAEKFWLNRSDMQRLLDVLNANGYEIIGPKVDQGAIVYDRLNSATELPQGFTDHQEPGKYRLVENGDAFWFNYAVGPHSWKKFLTPPLLQLLKVKKSVDGLSIDEVVQPRRRFAFLGVRGCELAALAIQDRVWNTPEHSDSLYQQRRSDALIIAIHCASPASTCFCTSMKTGPACRQGFDIAMMELSEGFVIEVGSQAGDWLLEKLPVRLATSAEIQQAQLRSQEAVEKITKTMPHVDEHRELSSKLKHPHWKEVASRCLSCANCTMVCPTCFCHSVEEVSDLNSGDITRQRQWDSCFNLDFSYTSGTPIRDTIASRYRQWLTHKLGTWFDQFETSGCVGCGRCITWCPVGIDLTKEVATLFEDPSNA
jgi:sulfhydrogenase subunit beta (sulfur reductase)